MLLLEKIRKEFQYYSNQALVVIFNVIVSAITSIPNLDKKIFKEIEKYHDMIEDNDGYLVQHSVTKYFEYFNDFESVKNY